MLLSDSNARVRPATTTYISGLNPFTYVMALYLPTPGFMQDVTIIHTGSVPDCWLGFIWVGLTPTRITKLRLAHAFLYVTPVREPGVGNV